MSAAGDDELHDLAALYALDALDGDERDAFEDHLAGCADCRAEVAELREVAADLADAVAEPPPPGLRDRVLSAASDVAQVPALPEPAVPAPATAPPAPAPTPLAPRRARRRPLAPFLAAAAAVVALVLGGLLVDARRDVARLEPLAAIAEAPDAESVELAGGPGDLRFTWSAEAGQGVLVADGVEAPPEGQTYQLWVVGDDGARSAGTFTTADGGTAVGVTDLPATGELMAVTVEPDGGSPQPTSDPIRVSDPV